MGGPRGPRGASGQVGETTEVYSAAGLRLPFGAALEEGVAFLKAAHSRAATEQGRTQVLRL